MSQIAPWVAYWKSLGNDFTGFVDDKLNLIHNSDKIVREYCLSTSSTFVLRYSTKDFGKSEINLSEPKKVYFETKLSKLHEDVVKFDGMPYIILGAKWLVCHHGPSRDPHACKKRASKKVSCPAIIILKDILTFPDYKVDKITERKQKQTSAKLRTDITKGTLNVSSTKRIIVIKFPRIDEHQFHITGEEANLKAPLDLCISQKIRELVEHKITTPELVLQQIKLHVKHLFGEAAMPGPNDRRFYPSRSDIRAYVYRYKKNLNKGLTDFDILETKLSEWRAKEDDRWFYRRSELFCIVYQSFWQTHLLSRYSNGICFLDATHKTNCYSLPLFFLCIQTNVGYNLASTFVVQKENDECISEALQIIKSWNPAWHPTAFLIDGSEPERDAIRRIFPESFVYMCEFHRKQAWQRWVTTFKNGVFPHKTDILFSLNKIADSLSEEEFQQNVRHLKNLNIWKSSWKLRNYVVNHWLKPDFVPSWVLAFWPNDCIKLAISKYGIVALNRVLEHEYLRKGNCKSLSSMVACLVDNFLPGQWRKYVAGNVTLSNSWSSVSPTLPSPLINMSPLLLRHLRQQSREAATEITKGMVNRISLRSFEVTSQKGRTKYIVNFGFDKVHPSCQCFHFRKHGLPCKHFLAVCDHIYGGFDWGNFLPSYVNDPVFLIDLKCFNGMAIAAPTSFLCHGEATSSFEDQTSHAPVLRELWQEHLKSLADLTYMIDDEQFYAEHHTYFMDLSNKIQSRGQIYLQSPSSLESCLSQSEVSFHCRKRKRSNSPPDNICKNEDTDS